VDDFLEKILTVRWAVKVFTIIQFRVIQELNRRYRK